VSEPLHHECYVRKLVDDEPSGPSAYIEVPGWAARLEARKAALAPAGLVSLWLTADDSDDKLREAAATIGERIVVLVTAAAKGRFDQLPGGESPVSVETFDYLSGEMVRLSRASCGAGCHCGAKGELVEGGARHARQLLRG
jgi:hypothetical protein